MHVEFPWNARIDAKTREIESLTRDLTMDWINKTRSDGFSEGDIYLLLALASARYVDHHGPFIGHGTFNGGPVFRASTLLSREYQDLALLQTALYVVDLLSNANYGPYLMMSMAPIDEDTLEHSEQAFLADVESGKNVLLAEHRLVGLLRHRGSDIRWVLTEAALRQYPENEHRLLIVYRAVQFLDDVKGWDHGEPILRAAVQYLASRPDTALVRAISNNLFPWPVEEEVSEEQVLTAVRRLIDGPHGNEPEIIDNLARNGASGGTLYESIALASSEMLLRSRFDAHAVTGIHCSLDLLRDQEVPPTLRTLAGHIALSSQRTGRQKFSRSEWREPLEVTGTAITLTAIRDIIQRDNEGLLSAQAVGNYLVSGGDPVDLARALMEIALTTSGPFDAIHNVKMVWGLLQQTQRSSLQKFSWRHLSAGARVIAETAATERPAAEPILSIWKSGAV